MNEEWRPVVGYEGVYEVSSIGRIRRTPQTNRLHSDGVLRPRPRLAPHRKIPDLIVPLTRAGRRRMFSVHQLVASAFLGTRQDGREVNHIDGNPQNNVVENLEWVTHSENIRASYRLGTHDRRGIHHGRAKFTDEIVRRIRELRGTVSQREIARRFRTSAGTVCDIQNRKSWKHVLVLVVAVSIAAVASEGRADTVAPAIGETTTILAESAAPDVLLTSAYEDEHFRPPSTNAYENERVRPISRGTDIPTIPDIITSAAMEFHVAPAVMLRRAFCESRYNEDSVGRAQEVSIFQFLPSTWMAYAPRLGYTLREIGHVEAQARVAAYLESIGEGRQWSCR